MPPYVLFRVNKMCFLSFLPFRLCNTSHLSPLRRRFPLLPFSSHTFRPFWRRRLRPRWAVKKVFFSRRLSSSSRFFLPFLGRRRRKRKRKRKGKKLPHWIFLVACVWEKKAAAAREKKRSKVRRVLLTSLGFPPNKTGGERKFPFCGGPLSPSLPLKSPLFHTYNNCFPHTSVKREEESSHKDFRSWLGVNGIHFRRPPIFPRGPIEVLLFALLYHGEK